MNKAKVVEYNLQIILECPNCSYAFDLCNYKIPEKISLTVKCDVCNKKLCVEPLNIVIKPKDSVTSSIVRQAKQIVRSYGFKTQEVNNVLNDLDTTGISLEELVKSIIAKVDQDEYATTK